MSLAFWDDVVTIQGPEGVLVVACDSCAGAGDKPQDRVRVAPYVVGRFAGRVPLLETLAVGAEPFLIVVTLGVEPEPTGAALLAGVREEALLAGVPRTNLLLSTEKNIPTCQTSLGVTVLARAPTGQPLRFGRARAGFLVAAVGLPKVGKEVGLRDPEIVDIPTLRRALAFPYLADVVPVGSGGIRREAEKMGRRAGLRFIPCPGEVDLEKSAGPATCFLAAVPPDGWEEFRRHLSPTGRPCHRVGQLLAPARGEAPLCP